MLAFLNGENKLLNYVNNVGWWWWWWWSCGRRRNVYDPLYFFVSFFLLWCRTVDISLFTKMKILVFQNVIHYFHTMQQWITHKMHVNEQWFSFTLADFLLQPFRKPKRVRTAFSPSQLLKLEHAFESNHYVVGSERKTLAQNLSLSETQVSPICYAMKYIAFIECKCRVDVDVMRTHQMKGDKSGGNLWHINVNY